MIDKSSAIPLYIQLAGHLRDLIYTGEFNNDTKLPTENVWMQRFGLGRATVRAAYAELEKEDLIYKKQGIGTFVKKLAISPGMLPLISLDYILKATGITTQNQVLEKTPVALDEELKKIFQIDILDEVYLIKRMRFAKMFPVAIETSYFKMEMAEKFKNADVTGSVAELLLSDPELKLTRISQDIISRDPNDKERKLLNLKKDETVLVLNRWLYKNGETDPFSYLEFIFSQAFLTYPLKYKIK